jgi:hypothetical protein
MEGFSTCRFACYSALRRTGWKSASAGAGSNRLLTASAVLPGSAGLDSVAGAGPPGSRLNILQLAFCHQNTRRDLSLWPLRLWHLQARRQGRCSPDIHRGLLSRQTSLRPPRSGAWPTNAERWPLLPNEAACCENWACWLIIPPKRHWHQSHPRLETNMIPRTAKDTHLTQIRPNIAQVNQFVSPEPFASPPRPSGSVQTFARLELTEWEQEQ